MKALPLKIGSVWPITALLLATLLMPACSNNDSYNEYRTVPAEGWHADSAVTFMVDLPAQHAAFNVYLNIRHQGVYPYRNLWLFVTRTAPDNVVHNDTIEMILADLSGRWYGEGSGIIYHFTQPYRTNRPMLPRGTYQYDIRQGMRDTLLKGITDVGLRLEYMTEE